MADLSVHSSSLTGSIAQPLSPTHAPGGLITELFQRRSKALSESRRRIVICREMRRNLLTVGVPEEWTDDINVRQVVEVVAPERQTIPLTMVNTLGAREPVWTRKAYGGTDRDRQDAEDSEVFLNGARKVVFPWEEVVGKLTEDGECGFVMLPRPATLEKRPGYVLMRDGERMPNPLYDRDASGRSPRESGYSQRSSRASIAAWRKDYIAQSASNFPIVGRVVNATDCVPIFTRGWGRNPYRVRGLIVRSLMEPEELMAEGFTWKGMEDKALIPRGYVSGRSTGQMGQMYLYEAFLTDVDPKTGEETPWAAYCVGGQMTANKRWSDERDSATINLKEEYGITRPTWSYFYGLHHTDDDMDYRGIPILWPIVRYIWNKEALLTAYLAHTRDNAFTGNIASPDEHVDKAAYLEHDGTFRKFSKPKSNEIKMVPGPVSTWPQATVSADARYMLEEFRMTIGEERDNATQDGRDSGHAMVVGDQLLKTAKRQIPDGATSCSEFAGEITAELCCGLARGEWQAAGGKPVDIYIFEDVERTLDSGENRAMREAVQFKDRWFGSNYSITAKMPKERNLAETAQLQALFKDDLAKFSEVREAMGDEHPETSFVEIQAFKWLTKDPIGQLTVDVEVANLRGMAEEAKRLEAVLAQKLNEAGFPQAALAPEFQGGGGQVPGMQVPDMANNVYGGVVAGAMGTASRQADANAQLALQPGQGPAA